MEVTGPALVFVCGNYYPFIVGGLEVFNHELISALVGKAQVTVINPNTGKRTDGINRIKVKLPLAVITFPLVAAYHILKINRETKHHVILSYARSRWFVWMVYPILASFFGVEYTIIAHSGSVPEWKVKGAMRYFFRAAKYCVGVSEPICNEYTVRSGRPVRFIPPLIPFTLTEQSKNQARQEIGIQVSGRVILMVGSLKRIKRQETAVDMLVSIGPERLAELNLYLVIAGVGSDMQKIVGLASAHGISERVVCLGLVDRKDMSKVYAAADYFFMPSEFEGTPISMLEAMANSLPVIGSNVSGINSMISTEKNGLLFELDNHKQAAIQLILLIENPEMALKLGMAGKKFYEEKYSYDAMLSQYFKLWGVHD